jgi:hypothetical protein
MYSASGGKLSEDHMPGRVIEIEPSKCKLAPPAPDEQPVRCGFVFYEYIGTAPPITTDDSNVNTTEEN